MAFQLRAKKFFEVRLSYKSQPSPQLSPLLRQSLLEVLSLSSTPGSQLLPFCSNEVYLLTNQPHAGPCEATLRNTEDRRLFHTSVASCTENFCRTSVASCTENFCHSSLASSTESFLHRPPAQKAFSIGEYHDNFTKQFDMPMPYTLPVHSGSDHVDASASSEKTHSEKADNTHLDGWPLYRAAASLNLSNGVAFVDIVGIGVLQPAISRHFAGNRTIDWATPAQLIGATIGQCILGYMSDVFSRRRMLLVALTILVLFSVGCALCKLTDHAMVFVAMRTFSGVAVGSISNLVNVAQNDFLPEERRLDFQGFQGISVALGSIIGSMAGGGFVLLGGWEHFYWMQAGLATVAFVCVWCSVPAHKEPPTRKELKAAIATIDHAGIISGIGMVVPALLLLTKFSQFSTGINIALAVIAGLSTLIFFSLGWYRPFDVRPVVPFDIFRNWTVGTVIVQSLLYGAAYYSFITQMPAFLELVCGITPIWGSAIMGLYFIAHGISSTASARGVRWLKQKGGSSYSIVLGSGFAAWTVFTSLLAWHARAQVYWWLVVPFTALVGLGTGSVFQNTVMAISAQVEKEKKAVAVGTRNVVRFLGGAIGLCVSSLVKQMTFKVPEHLGNVDIARLDIHSFVLADQQTVRDAAAMSFSSQLWVASGVVGLCLLITPLLIIDEKKKIPGDLEQSLCEKL